LSGATPQSRRGFPDKPRRPRTLAVTVTAYGWNRANNERE
jgi:hypothetical protein